MIYIIDIENNLLSILQNLLSSINDRGVEYMHAITFFLCLVIISTPCVWSSEVIHTMDLQNTCAGSYNIDEAMSSETLYNQTYALVKHEVQPWLYEVRSASEWMYEHFRENATLECAVVLYYNDVYVPDILVAFLDTFNLTRTVITRTKKQVCVDPGRVLVENEDMHVNLLGDFRLVARSEITAPDTLHTVVRITTRMPGYSALWISSGQVLALLEQAMREKIDTVSTSLCRIPSPSSSLRRAEDMKKPSIQV